MRLVAEQQLKNIINKDEKVINPASSILLVFSVTCNRSTILYLKQFGEINGRLKDTRSMIRNILFIN